MSKTGVKLLKNKIKLTKKLFIIMWYLSKNIRPRLILTVKKLMWLNCSGWQQYLTQETMIWYEESDKKSRKIQTPVWLQFLSKDNENNKRKFTFTIKKVFFIRRGASLSLLFFACLPIPNLKSIFDMPSQTNSQILDHYFAMLLF